MMGDHVETQRSTGRSFPSSRQVVMGVGIGMVAVEEVGSGRIQSAFLRDSQLDVRGVKERVIKDGSEFCFEQLGDC